MVSENDLEKIAALARLEIEPDFAPVVTKHFNSILEYFEVLQKIDTTGIEPTSHTNSSTNILRVDKVVSAGSNPEATPLTPTNVPIQEMLSTDALIQNLPDHSGSYIRVPLVVE